jgi:hypothetical protein
MGELFQALSQGLRSACALGNGGARGIDRRACLLYGQRCVLIFLFWAAFDTVEGVVARTTKIYQPDSQCHRANG